MSLTTKIPWEQANTLWAAELNPVLLSASNNSILIHNVQLVAGQTNVINHKLGRTMQGWEIADIQSPGATIYRNAPLNNQTLSLFTSATVMITLRVY